MPVSQEGGENRELADTVDLGYLGWEDAKERVRGMGE